jgi:ATP-dependent DNA helicase RecG
MSILPINLEDLIHTRCVESERVEFKKTWSEAIRKAVIKTISAFANDLHNLNGGYIVLGIDENRGKAMLPPEGLDNFDLDEIQKEIRGNCKRIDPEYQPVLAPETFMGKSILVIWAPAGDTRPYQAPNPRDESERCYFVRLGTESVQAKGEILNQLMQATAKVPFDDRRRHDVPLSEVSGALVKTFLNDIGSDLAASGDLKTEELLRCLRCTVKTNGSEAPRNIALLFFTENPEKYFPGIRIEIAHYGDETGGNLIEEKTLRGPLPMVLRQTLDYLSNLSTELIRKIPEQAETHRFVAFPYEAMEEALANAVLHRGYDSPPEPIKVGLYPDRMEIVSYPGPVPGLEMKHLEPTAHAPPLAQRNRRIGEFLKDLRLAELRNTGIPKIFRRMVENGSPQPTFEFDPGRTYFRVVLPAHPRYVLLHALREAAQLWATGERPRALARLEEARKTAKTSGVLTAQIIDYLAYGGDLAKAEVLWQELEHTPGAEDRHLVYLALARAHLDRQNTAKAVALLNKLPAPDSPNEAIELAVLYRRSGRHKDAHQLFAKHFAHIKDDPKAVHEFAQTKLKLAGSVQPRSSQDKQARRKLNQEARELLHQAILLADNDLRKGWAWCDLARCLTHLKAPESEIRNAYAKAIELVPDEPRFKEWRDEWERRQNPIH